MYRVRWQWRQGDDDGKATKREVAECWWDLAARSGGGKSAWTTARRRNESASRWRSVACTLLPESDYSLARHLLLIPGRNVEQLLKYLKDVLSEILVYIGVRMPHFNYTLHDTALHRQPGRGHQTIAHASQRRPLRSTRPHCRQDITI